MKQVTKLKWEGWGGKESRSLAGVGLGICVHGAVGVQSWERTELGKDRAGKGQSWEGTELLSGFAHSLCQWQPRGAAAIIKPQL